MAQIKNPIMIITGGTSNILYGTTEPDASLGENGDVYLLIGA